MPNAFERRTVVSRGRVVSDEIWLADDVRREAAWNDKSRWTLADLVPEEAKRPEREGEFEIVVRYRQTEASHRAQQESLRLSQRGGMDSPVRGEGTPGGLPRTEQALDHRRRIAEDRERAGKWPSSDVNAAQQRAYEDRRRLDSDANE